MESVLCGPWIMLVPWTKAMISHWTFFLVSVGNRHMLISLTQGTIYSLSDMSWFEVLVHRANRMHLQLKRSIHACSYNCTNGKWGELAVQVVCPWSSFAPLLIITAPCSQHYLYFQHGVSFICWISKLISSTLWYNSCSSHPSCSFGNETSQELKQLAQSYS